MGTMPWAESNWSPSPGAFSGCPHGCSCHHLLVSHAHQQETGSKVELLGLKLEPICDASTASGGLTFCAIMPVPFCTPHLSHFQFLEECHCYTPKLSPSDKKAFDIVLHSFFCPTLFPLLSFSSLCQILLLLQSCLNPFSNPWLKP